MIKNGSYGGKPAANRKYRSIPVDSSPPPHRVTKINHTYTIPDVSTNEVSNGLVRDNASFLFFRTHQDTPSHSSTARHCNPLISNPHDTRNYTSCLTQEVHQYQDLVVNVLGFRRRRQGASLLSSTACHRNPTALTHLKT